MQIFNNKKPFIELAINDLFLSLKVVYYNFFKNSSNQKKKMNYKMNITCNVYFNNASFLFFRAVPTIPCRRVRSMR